MEDNNATHACELELKGGLNGVDYKQKFVKAPLSDHPSYLKAGHEGVNAPRIMKMVMGK